MNARPLDRLVITIGQLNPIVGDIVGNAGRARTARAKAAAEGADLIVLSELFICGYPPEDLVLKPSLQAACRTAIEDLARDTAQGGPAMLIGTPWVEEGKLYNAVALLDGGRIASLRFKADLPNYGVFDEKRVFSPGPMPGPVNFRGVRLGVPICEDIWGPEPVECIAETGGEIILVANGSPYRRSVIDERLNVAVARIKDAHLPLVYVNQVGGQDELVFDGASFVLNADLGLITQLPAFREAIATVVFERAAGGWRSRAGAVAQLKAGDAADYAACVLGLRDYVDKNRFPGVVLGLSGGVDSALCAVMAVDALGAARVRSLMMPYRFTSQASLDDAREIATTLGIHYDVLPITPAIDGLEKTFSPLAAGLPRDVTEENLQARARGVLLMAVSNKFGLMVVTTGNKSEMSAGYATLYGDMNGGFNPVKDLYKTEVYHLSRLRNCWNPEGALGPAGRVIPENVLVRAPTAELRENQTDQDSLPPYEVLDAVLERLVEREEPISKIVEAGFDRDLVMRIERMLYIAEYKRRQAAPGVKVTLKSFGRDRRYPIVNRFRDSGAAMAAPSAGPRGIAVSGEAVDF